MGSRSGPWREFTADQGEIRVESVPVGREALESAVRELLPLLEPYPEGGVAAAHPGRSTERTAEVAGRRGGPRASLRRLYDLLIAPVAHHLPQQASPAPITFVPQGLLFLVPFPALLDSQDRPVLALFTPSITPAIGVLDSLHPYAPARWAASDVLVVGNPAPRPAYAHLGPLPGAEREAGEVAKFFKSTPLIGAAATREAVVAAMPRSRLIHLAGHGLLDHGGEKEVPGALVFASARGDGLLTAREIAGLRLRADLVVLSVCDSGRGRITGDGVVGLARSFLAAGAKGVIVSLWRLDDDATAFLMTRLYRHLQRTGNRAGALREAMLATRGHYPDPGRWAGFTFIGIEPGS